MILFDFLQLVHMTVLVYNRLRVQLYRTVREYSLRVQFENTLIVLRARDLWLLALLINIIVYPRQYLHPVV